MPRAVRLPECRAVRFSSRCNVNNAVNGVGVVYQSVVAPCHVYGIFFAAIHGAFCRVQVIFFVRDAEQLDITALHCKDGRKYKGRALLNNDVAAKVLQSCERGFNRVGVACVFQSCIYKLAVVVPVHPVIKDTRCLYCDDARLCDVCYRGLRAWLQHRSRAIVARLR